MKRGMGTKSCLKSRSKCMSQMPSAEAIEPAISLDSMEDPVTRPCFLDAQEMGEPLNVKVHLVVDFLLFMSPTKSASVKPARL